MKRILLALLAGLCLAATAFAGGDIDSGGKNGEPEIEEVYGPIDELPVSSAVLMELGSGRVLYEKNADVQLPPASMTKIMTMLLVIEAKDDGKITFDDKVIASEHASKMGGSQIYLKAGEEMPVLELFKAVSIASANDAAVALAEHVGGSEGVFVTIMNERAAELGMKNTSFKNACGLDAEGHLSTARDIAIMSNELSKHKEAFMFTTTWLDSVRNGTFTLTNTNKLVRSYKGITGLKTGATGKAKYCMSATAERSGVALCGVVMGAETGPLRFGSAAALLDYGFASFEQANLTEGVTLPELPVRHGQTEKLIPQFEGRLTALVPRGKSGEIEKIIVYDDSPLRAPIQKGARVGALIAKYNGEVIGEIPLVAPEEIGKLGFFGAFLRLLGSLGLF